MGLFLMFLALLAYFRVFRVSSKFTSAGDTQAIIEVLEFPPKESCNILVNLESLYGTYTPTVLPLARSFRAVMHCLRVKRDLLISIDSF